MRKIWVLIAALALVGGLALPGQAKVVTKTLGTDPAGDGPPALDVTYLKAGRLRANLYLEIGIDKMLPPDGGYHQLPGIEWVFDVKERTFIAEAVVNRGSPDFYLFELLDDGSARQLESPTGGYGWMNGYIHMLVPLKTIGAKAGTVISGAEGRTDSGGDVDAHVHYVAGTHYADAMTTTRDFVVP